MPIAIATLLNTFSFAINHCNAVISFDYLINSYIVFQQTTELLFPVTNYV